MHVVQVVEIRVQIDEMSRLCIIRNSGLLDCDPLFLHLLCLAHVHVVDAR